MNPPNEELQFTGERFLPEVHGVIELEHVHRYLFASSVAKGKVVLDIACGEGYGSAMLANVATHVIGVDIDSTVVLHAQKKYLASNLEYRCGSCTAIPLEDASVDVVVSFETIEHHADHLEMMREIKRVLRISGTLVISSPDKLEYSDRPGYHNPYHVKELYKNEFLQLVEAHFKKMYLYGQRVLYGSAILCETGSSRMQSSDISVRERGAQAGLVGAVYLIAVASDTEFSLPDSGVLSQAVVESEPFLTLSAEHRKMKVEQIALRAEIQRVKATVSWRITKPLRFIWNKYLAYFTTTKK